MDLIFSVRCQKGGVERVIDLPHFGEVELVCDQRLNFDNCEGSFMFQGKFGVCDRLLEISGF